MREDRLRRRLLAGLLLVASASLARAASGDSIAPDSLGLTLSVGESATLTKTVTVDAGTPTTARVDAFFLFDTTASMSTLIGVAQAAASALVTQTSALGDVSFGVGHYQDFPVHPFGSVRNVPFEQVLDITDDASAAEAALASLSTLDGQDLPESVLFGLEQAATTTSWRANASRLLLWFGDSPGHEGTEPGYPSALTTADVIDTLVSEAIRVEAIDTRELDREGQATAITDATGGDLWSLGSTDQLLAVLGEALAAAYDGYGEVTLGLEGIANGEGVSVDLGPATSGPFDRSVPREFEFDVTITGLAPGSYDFSILALVDGGAVAVESDHVHVVPEPATLPLLLAAIAALGPAARRRR